MSSNPGDTGQTVGFSFECVSLSIYIYISSRFGWQLVIILACSNPGQPRKKIVKQI